MASSPYINHFIQPDTIIPNLSNPQSWNRFSYVQNNPVRFIDPTGHFSVDNDAGTSLDDECVTADGGTMPCWIYPENHPKAGQIIPRPKGYDGPLPENIVDTLLIQGADEELVTGVTIHIASNSCSREGSVAETWFNNIYYCDPNYFDDQNPNGTLVHELIHVRQFRDGGWIYVLFEVWPAILKDKYMESKGIDWDIYKEFWAEKEGFDCQRAFNADPTISFDSTPCLIK